MAYNDFTSAEIEVGKAVKKSLWQKLKDNFTDHQNRITAIETSGSSKLVLFDKVIDLGADRVGDVKFNLTSDTSFNKLHRDWERMTGQSLSGKDLETWYASTCINAGGRFPRIEGASGVGAIGIGTLQGNQNYTHNHTLQYYSNDTGSTGGSTTAANCDLKCRSDSTGGPTWRDACSSGYAITSQGGNEARPDSAVIGAHVMVNDIDKTNLELFKVPYDCNIISAIVTNIYAGTAGTLEIDVLSGTSLSSVSSIFSTRPSVTSASGNYASSSNASISSSSLSANDWVKMSLTSIQDGQTRFHVYLLGEIS